MMQMKWGGMVLTGIAAFLIVNKIINAVRGSVRDVADASRWKAYYACKREDPLAPGYERVTQFKQGNQASEEASSEPFKDTVNAVAKKAIDNLFKPSDTASRASKGGLDGDLDGDGIVVITKPEENAQETSPETAE